MIVYGPMRSGVATNRPSLSVVTLVVVLVPVFSKATVALGTADPLWSVTTPVIIPVSCWARQSPAEINEIVQRVRAADKWHLISS